MRAAIPIMCAFLALSTTQHSAASDKATGDKLLRRAVDLMAYRSGYVYTIPRGAKRDQARQARRLTEALLFYARETKYRTRDDPFVIISTDPASAADVIRTALSDCPRRSLRRMRVVCVIGTEDDRLLRPYATAAGARLEVERVPQ